MSHSTITRRDAIVLILAGAAAPSASEHWQLGVLGMLGAISMVLALCYAAMRRADEIEAATWETERLDE